jgi:DNA-binding NtrC family response regulator
MRNGRIQLLQGIKSTIPLPVVIMTALHHGSRRSTRSISAPSVPDQNAKNDEIKLIVRNAIEMRRVRVGNQYLSRELRGHEEKTIIGVRRDDARVQMVEGGRQRSHDHDQGEAARAELIAREIHYGRQRGPFVSINCGAIPRPVGNNLFGHVKARSGRRARLRRIISGRRGGTFFSTRSADAGRDAGEAAAHAAGRRSSRSAASRSRSTAGSSRRRTPISSVRWLKGASGRTCSTA